MSEIEMHHGEAVLWIEALEWYMREHGLTVPTWVDIEQAGWRPAPTFTDSMGIEHPPRPCACGHDFTRHNAYGRMCIEPNCASCYGFTAAQA